MEHTKAYQEFKKNGNTKFVRYSEGAEMYHMSVSKFMQMAKDAKAVYKLEQSQSTKRVRCLAHGMEAISPMRKRSFPEQHSR